MTGTKKNKCVRNGAEERGCRSSNAALLEPYEMRCFNIERTVRRGECVATISGAYRTTNLPSTARQIRSTSSPTRSSSLKPSSSRR